MYRIRLRTAAKDRHRPLRAALVTTNPPLALPPARLPPGKPSTQPTRELLIRGDATGAGCHLPEHGWLGWSAADPADAIVAARVCLRGRGLPAANEHDIAQQQRIGP
jgi:hypothetical protein